MRRKLGEILLSSGMVGPGDIAEALADQSAGEPARLGDILVAAGKLTPAQLAQALAEQYGVPYTALPPLPTAVLEAVPLDFQRAHRLVPIRVDGTVLSIAMADLSDADAVRALQESWPQVNVFAAAADEIDALHGALFGEFPGAPPVELPDVAPPIGAVGSSPSADDLFASFDLEGDGPPPAAPPTASGLFGDLDLGGAPPSPTPSGEFDLTSSLESSPSAPSAPSGMFEVSVDDGVGAPAPAPSGPSGLFELTSSLDAQDSGDTSGEVLELTTEASLPPDGDDGEEELFFEARLASPSPAPIAPPPVVAPVASAAEPDVTLENEAPLVSEFLEGVPDGEPVPPLRDDTFAPAHSSGPSVLESLFISPDEPVAAADAAPPGPEPLPPAASPPAAKPLPMTKGAATPKPGSDSKPPAPKASPVAAKAADAKAPAKPAEPKATDAKAAVKTAEPRPPDTKSAAARSAEVKAVEAKADAKPAAAKPAEVKAVESKADARPSVAKPAEVKAVEARADAPPTASKPPDVKPAAAKVTEAKAPAAKPAVAKPTEVKQPAPAFRAVEPGHDAEKPAPRAPPTEKGAGLELPDWLRGDAAEAAAPDAGAEDLWTGELETLAPSKLITGVARALIRKGILTEQDVLEALERKKP